MTRGETKSTCGSSIQRSDQMNLSTSSIRAKHKGNLLILRVVFLITQDNQMQASVSLTFTYIHLANICTLHYEDFDSMFYLF